MTPGQSALVKGYGAIAKDVREGLNIPTKWAPVVDPLSPALQIVKRRQRVYSGIDGKLKNSLRDVPQGALPSNRTPFFHD